MARSGDSDACLERFELAAKVLVGGAVVEPVEDLVGDFLPDRPGRVDVFGEEEFIREEVDEGDELRLQLRFANSDRALCESSTSSAKNFVDVRWQHDHVVKAANW